MNSLEEYYASFNDLQKKAQDVGYNFCKDEITRRVLEYFKFPVGFPMIFFVVEIGIVYLAAKWYYKK